MKPEPVPSEPRSLPSSEAKGGDEGWQSPSKCRSLPRSLRSQWSAFANSSTQPAALSARAGDCAPAGTAAIVAHRRLRQ